MCSKCFVEKNVSVSNCKQNSEKLVVEDIASSQDTTITNIEPTNDNIVQEHPTRCFKCNKRVGYTIIQCRCGHRFCGLHRYSDQHSCTFDYKVLKVNSERVEADKVPNRLN